MKLSITFLLLLLIAISASAQSQNPNYDSTLASKMGGDDYGMKKYVLVILKSGSNKSEDKTYRDSIFTGHLKNISRLVKERKMIIAGPLLKNDMQYRGIFILDVDNIEAAHGILTTDPAVSEKFLEPELFIWYGSAALPSYLGTADKIWKINP